MVAKGLTLSPPAAPQECSTRGQSWPAAVPVEATDAGTQATVYGVAGAAMAPTMICLSGSGLSALMSLTNFATGVSRPFVSFEVQLVRFSVGAAVVPCASEGGLRGGALIVPEAGSVQRWPN